MGLVLIFLQFGDMPSQGLLIERHLDQVFAIIAGQISAIFTGCIKDLKIRGEPAE